LDETPGVGIEIVAEEIDALSLRGRAVSREELATLDELGYVVVPSLLPPTELEELRAAFDDLVSEDPQSRTHELGTRRSKADNENDVFAICWRHRLVLEAAAHLLGERFQVGHVDLRDPDPGHGEQRHHPDHGDSPVAGLTITWYLDDFTADNGATRVVPGSHRSQAPALPIDPLEPVPGEVVAAGPAGSVLLRDARLYHGAGRNAAGRHRRSAFVFYQHHIPEPLY
jgi:ectoine hydroxylase-related dioxygenase (phytanoyl-CoA dioxygenase family)